MSDIETRYPDYPWSSLDGATLGFDLALATRRFWSDNAFTEYASSIAMTDISIALARAGVDPDLRREVAGFAADELVHSELCAAVAERAGGKFETPFDPRTLHLPELGELAPLERATTLVVRVFCLGETVSLRLLAGNLRATRHPLARAVLERIVRDEARHARFGWAYLAWVAPRLSADERRRLGDDLARDLAALAPIIDAPPPGSPTSGLGWMSPDRWYVVMRRTLDVALLRPLARHGIAPTASVGRA